MGTHEGLALGAVALLLTLWSLAGRRVERWGITEPMAFIVVGMVLAKTVAEDLTAGTVLFLAELTLVLVLFHDASTVRLAQLRRDPWIAVRLLAVGFPLALLLTTVLTWWLLPVVGLAGAVLIAGAVTATDAGLGAPTILNPAVPMRARRALNVESGLNDGLATPVVLLGLGSLLSTESETADSGLTAATSVDIPSALGGVGLGLVLGVAFAFGVDRSRSAGWSSERARALGMLAVPLLCFGAAEAIEANIFLTAFVSGLAFGGLSRIIDDEPDVSQPLEVAADIFSGVLWFLAGGLVVVTLEDGFRLQWLVLAVAALTVLRVVPVALALLGGGFRWPTVLFFGWFGPRGVATIVFGLITAEALGDSTRIVDIAGVLSLTVLISVFAHGITAGPLADRYGAWARRTQPPIESEP